MEQPRYTPAASHAVTLASSLAEQAGDRYTGTGHLLLALLKTPAHPDNAADNAPCIAASFLRSHGITEERTAAFLSVHGMRPAAGTPFMTPSYKRILSRAAEEAARFRAIPASFSGDPSVIGTEHLLYALLCENDSMAAHLFSAQNVPPHELYGDVLSYLSSVSAENAIVSGHRASSGTSASRERGKDTEDIPVLPGKYGTDLTAEAAAGKLDPVIGRDAECADILRILLRRQKNNPCLLGEPGVGKTAVVEEIARRIACGNVPEKLLTSRIIALDLGAMIAGAKYRGEFEERLKAAVSACTEDPSVILFLDEIHTVMGAGAAEGAMDAANLLKPALSRGKLHLIGATTQTEYRKTIEKDGAMERRFQPVLIGEPDEETAVSILSALRPFYERHHGVSLPDETLRAAVRLTKRYLPDRYLPDKAIDCIDEAAAARSLQQENAVRDTLLLRERDEALLRGDTDTVRHLTEQLRSCSTPSASTPETLPAVTVSDLAAVLTRRTGIPIADAETASADLSALEERLRARVIGQDDAVRQVSDAIRRMHTGIRDPNRPAASFLFTGPTGVGKTALSRALAELLFGSGECLIRIDLSEYMEKHAAARLIGAPPGYVGYEGGGYLTEQVHRHPYSVILFDEIEKAHPDVMHLFLQLLDEGRLTDSHGRTADFRNTVVIMTSNLGASSGVPRSPLGFASAGTPERDTAAHIKEVLSKAFSMEFLNRIDAVIPFRPLGEDALQAIARLLLNECAARLAERDLTLRYTDAALRLLVREGSDPAFGARPLRRAVTEQVETPLSALLSSGSVVPGDTVMLRVNRGRLQLKKA